MLHAWTEWRTACSFNAHALLSFGKNSVALDKLRTSAKKNAYRWGLQLQCEPLVILQGA